MPSSGARLAAAVALPVPIDSLFDYAVPQALDAAARPGCRVRVPFGRRHLTGVIVERRLPETHATLRRLAQVLDAEPVLSETMLGILREEARAVLCPIGQALTTALPPGATPRAPARFGLTRRGRAAHEAGVLRGPAREVCARLAEGDATLASLRRRHPEAAEVLAEIVRDRLVETVEVAARGPQPIRVRLARLVPGSDLVTARATLARAPRQVEVVSRLARDGPCETSALAPGPLRALVRRGLVEIQVEERRRDVLGEPLETPGTVSLSSEQEVALAPIIDAARARRFEHFLLHGVTGSGKTEVYLRAVAEALAQDRQALILVPEITLTHQILARLRARFGDDLAVLHSGLSPAERWEQWERLRRGQAPIAVGARSALFAPLERLGLVVIDEEHDGAYKNEEGFRYHARDLAVRRARAADCPLVLGSATPALETRYAADAGALRHLRLPRRIGGRPLPGVQIVDLERARAATPRGRKLILTPPLRRALRETVEAGGQALLLHNRRGFSTKVLCFDCGHAEHCKHCDIALVYHAPEDRLRCHYCDYQTAPPEVCSGCGAPDTALLGIGTQRVEEEVRASLPQARVARLDRDAAVKRGATERILRALRDREVDVVVGTQMLAKGHDFPGVRLVGVVLADLGLHMPDFRAAERTFQLLTQVAGRAGRGRAPGRVVIQTFSPQHYAVSAARRHDYETFYAEELAQRRALGYPPFGHLVHALVSSPDEDEARGGAERLADAARGPGREVLGPAAAPLARLRDRFRIQVLVRGADAADLLEAGRRMRDAASRLPATTRAKVDPNPLNML
jgi:primosomal protein N' (replication factor Y)